MVESIPLFKVLWDDDDIERVNAVIRRGMYWAIGPEVREFERIVADYVGVGHAYAANSGTSALHALLVAHGVGGGDEVIVPSFTFIATANAPLFVGAVPVFADIEEETYGLDPQDVERKITGRTKAILPVHYGGCPCRIEELRKIASERGLLLIEDAAEALGAAVGGRRVGRFGDSAILSFCAPKIITTGEGGMILTNSSSVYEKVSLICNHGRAETGDYFSSTEQMEYVTLGYNFRMSTMTAALGIAQMHKVDDILRMRRHNASRLTQGLSNLRGVVPPREPEGRFHVYQLYTIRVSGPQHIRDRLKTHLAERRIGARVYFAPVHLTRFYRERFGYVAGRLPVTERVAAEVLSLPMYPGLADMEIDYIADAVREFFAKGGDR